VELDVVSSNTQNLVLSFFIKMNFLQQLVQASENRKEAIIETRACEALEKVKAWCMSDATDKGTRKKEIGLSSWDWMR